MKVKTHAILKLLWSVIVTTLFFGHAIPCFADEENNKPRLAIQYEQLPTQKIFKGNPVTPKLKNATTRRYRTVILEGAKKGPNFAGEYTIVEYGCGSCCNAFFIVNARTGKVFIPPFFTTCHYEEGVPGYGNTGLGFHINSNLLVATGARNERGGGEYYYIWKNDRLSLLKALEERSNNK